MDAVVDGYRDGGYTVEITQRLDTFARLAVTDPAQPDHPCTKSATRTGASPPMAPTVLTSPRCANALRGGASSSSPTSRSYLGERCSSRP